MFPLIRKLVPVEGMNEAGKCYISLDVVGNPNLSAEFIDEMRKELPNCEFHKITFIPKGTEDRIEVGMLGLEVVDAVGEVMLQERKDWVWDSAAERQRCVRRLGAMHEEYFSPDGLETWTYFADEMGIAVLGIDFHENGTVSAVWHDRGSPPPGRGLTPVKKTTQDVYQ